MSWNANIWVKSNGQLSKSDWYKVKNWQEVEQIWSTQGDWDWLIKLKSSLSSWDDLEKWVNRLRQEPWVAETATWWAKEL